MLKQGKMTRHHKEVLQCQLLLMMQNTETHPRKILESLQGFVATNDYFRSCEKNAKDWIKVYFQECLDKGEVVELTGV